MCIRGWMDFTTLHLFLPLYNPTQHNQRQYNQRQYNQHQHNQRQYNQHQYNTMQASQPNLIAYNDGW